MRAFIGIPIPEYLKSKIIRLQDEFSEFDIKLVEPENLHFNLKFFREIDDNQVNKLKDTLKAVSSQFKSFEIGISGIGAFPNKNYIRVIWLGVKEGYTEFCNLTETTQKVVESLGFERENRFVPHLTLGRVRSARNKNELIVKLAELENTPIGSMKIEELILFQSKLGPNGPVYEELFKIKL